jgi:hypothetical protein
MGEQSIITICRPTFVASSKFAVAWLKLMSDIAKTDRRVADCSFMTSPPIWGWGGGRYFDKLALLSPFKSPI